MAVGRASRREGITALGAGAEDLLDRAGVAVRPMLEQQVTNRSSVIARDARYLLRSPSEGPQATDFGMTYPPCC